MTDDERAAGCRGEGEGSRGMTLREDIAMVLEDAYWLGSDAAIGRCEDDSSMLIARGYTDRIMAHIDRLLAERDIDAMLDAVHPQARLNYLGYADFDLCWNAYLWTPDFVATTGTGPTRLEAIADACRKAREGQPRGLREDTTP